MRKLLVVPIIHTSSDMGSLAPSLSEASSNALGAELWQKHLAAVARFWESIAQFFTSRNNLVTQIYQDGLVADGEDGLKIINEGARRGSLNYQIILTLLKQGAALIKTEDIALVQKEYDFLKKMTSAKSAREREAAGLRYRLAQNRLIDARDRYIAGTIDRSLSQSDTGVLFIGAYHEVIAKLAADIQVVQAKEVNLVREYHQILTNLSPNTRARYQQLAEYLVSPVVVHGI